MAFNTSMDKQKMNSNERIQETIQTPSSHTFYDDQCESMTYDQLQIPLRSFKNNEQCESILANMPNPPTIEFGWHKAMYVAGFDVVAMPIREHFKSPEYFYSVLFHELIHSTGHTSRLNRLPISNPVENISPLLYAREELVAEMGSAFLCGFAGIENKTISQSYKYMESYEPALEGDSRVVMYAVGAAERAVGYILGHK